MELLYPVYLFTTCLSENHGPTLHKVYNTYNNLFDHPETSIDRLSRKRALWKKQTDPSWPSRCAPETPKILLADLPSRGLHLCNCYSSGSNVEA
jgi:hypothetical protein